MQKFQINAKKNFFFRRSKIYFLKIPKRFLKSFILNATLYPASEDEDFKH